MFGTPLALFGVLATSIPLIAHLARRHDLPRQSLPTIALLERALAKTKRRRRLDDVVLLAVRALGVAVLALALADPFVERTVAYGHGEPVSLCIVVDDSMSMQRSVGNATLIDRAIDNAQRALAGLPDGSEASVIGAGRPARILTGRTTALPDADGKLESLRVRSFRGTDLPTAITLASNELAASAHSARILLVETDGAAHAELENIDWPPADVQIDLDLAPSTARTDNLTVASAVAAPDPTNHGGASIRVEVVRSGAPIEGQRTLELRDGNRSVDRTQTRVGPHGTIAFLRAPSDPMVAATVQLDARDALPLDDSLGVLIDASSSINALLVSGEPAVSRDDDEVGFLARALDAIGTDRIRYRITDPSGFDEARLDGFDIVVLANVRGLLPDRAAGVREFVEHGGGLLVASGEGVSRGSYDSVFGPFLPAHQQAPVTPVPALTLAPVPRSGVLPDGAVGLSRAQLRRLSPLSPRAGSEVVIAAADGAPLLVVASRGQGRVAMLATTIDGDWTDLPYRPGYVILVSQIFRYLSRPALPSERVEPFETISIPVRPGTERLVVTAPDGQRAEHTVASGAHHVEIGDAGAAGIYAVDLGPNARTLHFVVAPPIAESDLTLADPNAARPADHERPTTGALVRQSLAPWCFFVLGACFVGEACLRLGFQRRTLTTRSIPARSR